MAVRGRKRRATTARPGKSPIPKRIFAQASPRSIGGVSLFEGGNQINSSTVMNFYSEQQVINRAVEKLRAAGFEILYVSPTTINIAGSQRVFEEAFNTHLTTEERGVIKEFGRKDSATFIESPETELPGLIATEGTTFADILEGVAIEEPRYFMAAPSAFPPTVAYWHLDVPADVSLGCNADLVHRGGITGKGIRIAMVDSGHYKHPFFVQRGYRLAPVVLGPAAANPLKDESGHGTGESANIFAVAPDIELLPVKINFVNSKGAFDAAVALNPDIITCSWGSSVAAGPLSAANQALAASIASAVAAGIIVVFSAGNGHAGFPGQHPDVISAGGVYVHPNGDLEASNYASGFMSQVYPNRRVPDVCGLVGLKPKAAYIMLPLEPGDDIDMGNAGGTHPNGDETANNDGWAAFSGTSAAAPQLAGVAALVKQACSKLTPQQVRNTLMKTARDVSAGRCNVTPLTTGQPPNLGFPAAAGPDLATGEGLVDAHKAVLNAKLQCLPIVGPVGPIPPITPVRPIEPITPVRPIEPITPVRPIEPITPVRPIQPTIQPTIRPTIQPTITPVGPRPQQGQEPSAQFTPEDIEALQKMAQRSEITLDDLNPRS